MSKVDIIDGPKSEEELFRALRESRNGHTVLLNSNEGKKLHAMVTTLGVPEGRGKPWRLSGQARWDHIEKWVGELTSPSSSVTVRHMIFEFSATYFLEDCRGEMEVGKYVGDV